MKKWLQNNRNSGFSLVEMMAAAAVLIILLGVSAVAVAYYVDYLKITELDNAAREIYMAAENRATLLNGSARLTTLVDRTGNTLDGVETGAGGETVSGCYISLSDIESDATGDLLPDGSIDPALLDGNFYIVYEPVSGCVTDVFYTEEKNSNITEASFQEFYTNWKPAAGRERENRNARMGREPMLGYYGGGKADGSTTSKLHTPGVTVLIHNEEELWVEVAFLVPEDAADASVQKSVKLTYGGVEIDLMDARYNSRLRGPVTANSSTYAWTLDSLNRDAGGDSAKDPRFSKLFSGSPGSVFGKDFEVAASIEVSAPGRQPSSATASDTDNSLFAEGSDNSDGKAYIKYLRHLQNLDSSFSQVDASFKEAEQQSNIRCYSNETYRNFADFEAIDNEHLSSYDGKGKEIRDLFVEYVGSAGLFSRTWKAMTFRGVRLVNATVTGKKDTSGAGGAPAGGLVGTAWDDISFDDCRVYWEPTDTSTYIDLLGSDAEGDAYKYQINGAAAGGLAGDLMGSRSTITNCLSATLISGSDLAGGLVGRAVDRLDVSGSYADCYLKGKGSAGLIGDGRDVTLENCYAAGFIDMGGTEKAAGLCLGGSAKVTATHVYSVMRPFNHIGSGTFYYLTETQKITYNDTFTQTYYLRAGSYEEKGIEEYGRLYDEMRNDGFAKAVGGEFTASPPVSHPYNLRTSLPLTEYAFPGLKLPHYCDWTTEFKEPSLVYYERYAHDDDAEMGDYGFSGGNARTLDQIRELSDSRSILTDGYAVAVLGTDLDDSKMTPASLRITYTYAYDSAGNPQTVGPTSPTEWHEAWGKTDGDTEYKKYYLIPLPNTIPTDANEDFYQYLKFSMEGNEGYHAEGEYFYNPHFSETVKPVREQDRPQGGWDPKTIRQYAQKQIADSYNQVDLRTPRHLYELSRHPEYYNNSSHSYRFQQRLDLDYTTYTEYGGGMLSAPGFRQKPIGTSAAPFLGTYNGGYHSISGVMFQDTGGDADYKGLYAGLFGRSRGALNNVVYHMPEGQTITTVRRRGETVCLGSLVGWNDSEGTVFNCAASGLRLDARGSYSWFYIGGLVGQNSGTIQKCGVEAPSLTVENNGFGTAYMGGLAGRNTGVIESSYAVGRLNSNTDQYSNGWIGGFAGSNGGTITNSYAAAHLQSSGGRTTVGGFCGVSTASGSQSGDYYLNMGNFTYRGVSYAAVYKDEADGVEEATYAELTEPGRLPGMGWSGSGYPYPTGVEGSAAGTWIYPGEKWPEPMELGTMGIYYWEKLEVAGETNYYVSLLAADPLDSSVTRSDTLVRSHDDGGAVIEYGYGHYAACPGGVELVVRVSAQGIYYYDKNTQTGSLFQGDREQSAEEDAADQALARLMPGFAFHSYRSLDLDKTMGGLYPTTAPNGSLTLRQSGTIQGKPFTANVTFELNPFFADAMSVRSKPAGWTVSVQQSQGGQTAEKSDPEQTPGLGNNVYGVRAIEQLEFINWNSENLNTTTVLKEENYSQFPYLTNPDSAREYYWTQSHDIEGEKGSDDAYKTYTPIAEYYDPTTQDWGNLYGWFSGTYDGKGYMIKNVSVENGANGEASSVAGLFGVVCDGTLRDIILYSADGEGKITAKYNSRSNSQWAAIGGLVGAAFQTDDKSGIFNCAVAGYTIDASFYNNVTNANTWGGAGIGGLVGITNMDLEGCSAVTNIEFIRFTANDNVRVGGLAGSAQSTISNSYAGGSIKFANEKKEDIQFGSTVAGGSEYHAYLYIGGIVGGSYFKPVDVAGERVEAAGSNAWNNTVENCYCYVELPSLSDEKSSGKIKGIYALGGIGDLNASGSGDGKKDHGSSTIENSYYLDSETLKNNEKADLISEKQKPANIRQTFRTDVDDPQAVALSYEELTAANDTVVANKGNARNRRTIYQWLNDPDSRRGLTAGTAKTAGPFYPVTTEINSAGGSYSVEGKFSYPPASRPELHGMNYPFPTILTRVDGTENRHVHYGEWPINGISRAKGSRPMELDLFAGGGTTLEELVRTADVDPNGTWSVWIADTEAGAIAKIVPAAGQTLDENGVLTAGDNGGKLSVTIAAVPPELKEGEASIDLDSIGGTTTMTVTYTEPDGTVYTRPFTVNVTARLSLSPARVTLFTNDTLLLAPELANRDGDPLTGELKLTGVQYDGTVQAEPAEWDEGGATTFAKIKLTSGGEATGTAEVINAEYLFTAPDGKTYSGAGSILAEAVSFETALTAVEGSDGKAYDAVFNFGGRAVQNLRASTNAAGVTLTPAPEGAPAVRLALAQPPEGTREVGLKLALTLDGQQHELNVTLTLPPKKDGETEEETENP